MRTLSEDWLSSPHKTSPLRTVQSLAAADLPASVALENTEPRPGLSVHLCVHLWLCVHVADRGPTESAPQVLRRVYILWGRRDCAGLKVLIVREVQGMAPARRQLAWEMGWR